MEDYRSKLRSAKNQAKESSKPNKTVTKKKERTTKSERTKEEDGLEDKCKEKGKPKTQFIQTNLESYFPPSPYGKSRQETYGDRFIPSRDRDIVRDFQIMEPSFLTGQSSSIHASSSNKTVKPTSRIDAFFRAELFDDLSAVDEYISPDSPSRTPRRVFHYTTNKPNTMNHDFNSLLYATIPTPPSLSSSTSSSSRAVVQPTVNRKKKQTRSSSSSSSSSNQSHLSSLPSTFIHSAGNHQRQTSFFIDSPNSSLFQTTPISEAGRRILSVPDRLNRSINSTPIKILDAPDLKDDFYLNLVDWGTNEMLAVGLGTSVYLWNANTSRVTKLCDLVSDYVASVKWSPAGSLLCVGSENGKVILYDTETLRKVRVWRAHHARVGTLAWKSNVLSSGGRDHLIFHHDVRSSSSYFRKLTQHSHEICGLKWNPEGTMLASGGNDNDVLIWDSHHDSLLHRFSHHKAAVKAICWSPHKRGVLASGGGSMDKTIKFWNAISGTLTSSYDTGSQVCNLIWSKRSDEIVSSHGYSNTEAKLSNQVIVWKADKMQKLATLTGHTSRVLYMTMSHDGSTIVTGAGDQTLRFWDLFSSVESIRPNAPKDRQACLR
ncbi:WD40-repeat-containing domain protein [Cokeromyces recurvatus]|uniref:WD40-repeat-containing domain protein n=1 Tax=Cokeromyces recurvatus TaxID=90255 RepID=UPI00221EA673|nr:WD40-repeat-containing domain protein [Cokeromyces recurvatus]KAI7899817.1 WD40-repeat-containing domain protein [Cokeromyces recurvatus]